MSFNPWEDMPTFESLRQEYKPGVQPGKKPTPTKKQSGSEGHSVRNQPRDTDGKWTKGFKKLQKRTKKVRRTLSPTYHKRRVLRMRRANERDAVRREFGSYAIRPKRAKRRVSTRKPVQQQPLWRRLLGF